MTAGRAILVELPPPIVAHLEPLMRAAEPSLAIDCMGLQELGSAMPLPAGTVVLLPDRLGASSGLDRLRELRRQGLRAPVVLLGSGRVSSVPQEPGLAPAELIAMEAFAPEVFRRCLERLSGAPAPPPPVPPQLGGGGVDPQALAQVEEIQQHLVRLQEELAERDAALAEAREVEEKYAETVQVLVQGRDRDRTAMAELQHELDEARRTERALRTELEGGTGLDVAGDEAAAEEVEALRRLIGELEGERDAALLELEERQRRLDELGERLEAAEGSFQDGQAALLGELESLRTRTTELEAELAESHKGGEEARARNEELERVIEERQGEIKELRSEIEGTQRRLDEASHQKEQELEAERRELEQREERVRQRVEELETKMQASRSEEDRLRTQSRELEDRLLEMEKAAEKRQHELDALLRELAAKEERNSDLGVELEKVKEGWEEEKEARRETEEKLFELEHSTEESAARLEQLTEELESRDRELEETRSRLEERAAASESELAESQSALDSLRDEILESTRAREALAEELEGAHQRVEARLTELSELRIQMADLEKRRPELAAVQRELEESERIREKQRKALEAVQNVTESQAEELAELRKQLDEVTDRAQRAAQSASADQERVTAEHVADRRRLTESLNRLQKVEEERRQLERRLGITEKQFERSRTRVKELEARVLSGGRDGGGEELRRRLETLEDERSRQVELLSAAHDEITTLRARNEDLERIAASSGGGEVEDLRNKLEEAETRVVIAGKRILELEEQVGSRDSAWREVESLVREAEAQREASEAELARVSAELEKARQELQRLESLR